MAKEFLLEITTPARLFMMEMVEMVILPAADGENGILAGHEKMVTALVNGAMHIFSHGAWRVCYCSQGYATVYGDMVIVLVQSVEWSEEIDKPRAEAALARAQGRLATEETPRDRVLSQMAESRALARLRVLDIPPGTRTKV